MYIGGLYIGGLGEGGSSFKKKMLPFLGHLSEAMYIGGLGEGRSSEKKKKSIFSLATSPPKGSHIYIYTHYVCFSSFLFSGDLHDSLDVLS